MGNNWKCTYVFLPVLPIKWSNVYGILSHHPVLEFFYFIFIAVPISSFNPCAFPQELKLKQTTIKLIEAARYQLRCSHPRQQIPPLTLQDPYSLLPVKIQFTTCSRWPSFWLSFWMAVIETLAGLITMLVEPPCCGSDTNATDWQHRPSPFITPCIYMYLFSAVISNCFSSANWLPFLSLFSREPPWFNGTSKVRRACRLFYFSAFRCLCFGSFLSNWFTVRKICLNKICLIVWSECSSSLVSCGFSYCIELLIAS